MLTDGLTDGRTDGRTENRTPISHPATSRCDKNEIKTTKQFLFHCSFLLLKEIDTALGDITLQKIITSHAEGYC